MTRSKSRSRWEAGGLRVAVIGGRWVTSIVVPAQAGTHFRWIPAFTGMTGLSTEPSEASAFISLKTNKCRFLADLSLSTQSEILRPGQDDSEGLEMTAHFKAMHAKPQRREEAQSGTPFFALRASRALRLGVKRVCPVPHRWRPRWPRSQGHARENEALGKPGKRKQRLGLGGRGGAATKCLPCRPTTYWNSAFKLCV